MTLTKVVRLPDLFRRIDPQSWRTCRTPQNPTRTEGRAPYSAVSLPSRRAGPSPLEMGCSNRRHEEHAPNQEDSGPCLERRSNFEWNLGGRVRGGQEITDGGPRVAAPRPSPSEEHPEANKPHSG